MKKYNYITMKLLLMLFVTGVFLVGCTKDEKFDDHKVGQVFLKLSLAHSSNYDRPFETRAVFPQEGIDDVQVFVFESANDKRFLYKASIEKFQGNDGQYQVALNKTVDGERVDFVVVANAILPLESEIVNYSGFINSVVLDISDLSTMGNIPLWGVSANLTVDDTLSNLSVDMLKPISKFNVQISPNVASDFKLSEVFLYNTASKAHVGYFVNANGPVLPNAKVGMNNNPVTLVVSGSKTESHPLLESAKGNLPFIIIGGKYKGDAKNTYYKVGIHAVKRNKNYTYVITKVLSAGAISKEKAIEGGETAEADIQSWNDDIHQMYYSNKEWFGLGTDVVELGVFDVLGKAIPVQTNIRSRNVKQKWQTSSSAASEFFAVDLTDTGAIFKLNKKITNQDRVTFVYNNADMLSVVVKLKHQFTQGAQYFNIKDTAATVGTTNVYIDLVTNLPVGSITQKWESSNAETSERFDATVESARNRLKLDGASKNDKDDVLTLYFGNIVLATIKITHKP